MLRECGHVYMVITWHKVLRSGMMQVHDKQPGDRPSVEATNVDLDNIAAALGTAGGGTAVERRFGEDTEAQPLHTLAVEAGCMHHTDSEAVVDGGLEGAGNFDLVANLLKRLQNFQPHKPRDWKCGCCQRAARQVSARECPSRLHALLRT